MIDWIWQHTDELANITSTATIIFLVIVLILTRKQLRTALGASAIQIFESIHSDLNTRESRSNRRFIYEYKLSPEQILANELIHSKVESVCVSLDHVGVVLRNNLIPKGPAQELYFDMYVDVFIRCWAKLEDYVKLIREKRNNPQHYRNFELLAGMARQYWEKEFSKSSLTELVEQGEKKEVDSLSQGEKIFRTKSSEIICDRPQTWFRVRVDDIENIRTDEDSKYTVAEIGPSVGVVALDENEKLTLVGQWRYTLDKYSWEIPTGVIEQDENEFEAAARELLEETGLRAEKWTKLGTIDNSNGSTIDVGHLFLATGLTQLQPRPDPNEIIEIKTIGLWKTIELVYQNQITESLSVAAILKAGYHLAKVSPQ